MGCGSVEIRVAFLACGLAAAVGCTGDIEPGKSPVGPAAPGAPWTGGPSGAAGAGDNGSRPGTGGGDEAPVGAEEDAVAPATRAARLTHQQWQNSVADLFYLTPAERDSLDFTSALRSDPVQSGFVFDNNALSLEVDESLFIGYQRNAALVAEYVTGDAARLGRIVPASGGAADARARQFVESFGLRAHRRPLTAQETDEYLALYAMGPAMYPGMPAFESGVRLLIEAFLQSPYFLYRVEESVTEAGGRIALSPYEVASRLSYALWNSMPDDALFDAAAGGMLASSAQAASAARRMLDDPRAQDTVESFHRQLFDSDGYAAIAPSPAFFRDAPEDLGISAQTEQQMFVGDVFSHDGGLTELLTSTDTFVNADLADVYGLSGSYGPSFTKAALDPAERKGILTQVGFLASNATSVNPDPIHRGVFIARRITCAHIAAPPPNVPPLPDPDGRTNRQLVEDHTQNPSTVCVSCHGTIINPLGFPFENYDAIGQFRTEDNGQPVDAASEALVGEGKVAVANALELVDALAASDVVHECYAKHWVEFTYGRPEADEDARLIARLGDESLDGAALKDMIIALVTSPAFLTRSTEELP